MRRILMDPVTAMLLGAIIFWISPVMAGQPQDAIINSTGYPSRPHFNWNDQKKDPGTFLFEKLLSGVKSVFIDKYAGSTIQYVTNIKSNVTDLMAQESCAEYFNEPPDATSATVILPYEREGLYVFSRVRAIFYNKQNGSNPDFIEFYPNLLGNIRNDVDSAVPDSPFSITPFDAHLRPLESSNIRYVHNNTPEKFVLYDLAPAQGKEKTKPSDATHLFKWLGSFIAASILDTNSDGKTDAYVFSFVRYY